MNILYVGLHAGLGEIGALAFLWVFVELLDPNVRRVARAKTAALAGTISLFLAWIIGGYYYLTTYNDVVKPIIKDGPMSWSHNVMMETKEHIFLFLPFLAILVLGLINARSASLAEGKKIKSILALSLLVFLIALAMAAFGYLISTGFREAITA